VQQEDETQPREGTGRRAGVLYLAPWVDYGGTDKGTIDWFRWLDRERFAPSLITTQPSLNRRLAEVIPYADEVWAGTEFLAGEDLPRMIFDFIQMRGVEVLHIMNSRLAFDLLPDLAALPRPPAVVVQLHVEEQDKSGYVRYVTTRYGNLVDAFSLTSHHLADAVERYDIPRSKCRVIYTGVDAEEEFSPEHVEPIDGLESGPVNILYPGRLVEQKDPLLMVKIASALRGRGLDFRIHVVGEGPLETEVRSRVSTGHLEDVVRFHPPTQEIARWFAACDLLLMTSIFEGVPYVIYEAMAMAVPIVAPALPGNAELMDEACGTLVSPRGHADGYVEALARLIEDRDLRRASGEHARARVRGTFSLRQMGEEHARLYDELLARRASGTSPTDGATLPEPIRLRNRPSRGTPLVTAIVPCFNHGRYLAGCLESIRAQSYPAIETIVVDDCSDDPQTRSMIAQVERNANDVKVIRMPENGGPSAARNAALPHARGRYLLPVDADNLLLPEAVERLVNQLQGAGENIGFIYPNLQYFGARNEYFEAPDYNLNMLLEANFADTSSLLDRELFDAGLRYPEDIRLGHEDWDFALSLAEREVYGQPAAAKTLLYRKMGFTRSDTVEYAADLFHERIVERHPLLFQNRDEIKACWSPAVSLIPLEPIETAEEHERIVTLCEQQGWRDFELIARSSLPWPNGVAGGRIRRLPVELARSHVEALETALDAARGTFRIVTSGNGLALLEDRGFTGKIARTLSLNQDLGAIALTDAGPAGRFPLRLLRREDHVTLEPHAIAWRTSVGEHILDRLRLAERDVLGGLTGAFEAHASMQWRHAPRPEQMLIDRGGQTQVVRRQLSSRRKAALEAEVRRNAAPAKSGLKAARRWKLAATWMPPETDLICRHVSDDRSQRTITNQRKPPDRYALEYDVGMVRKFAAPGTSRLVRHSDGTYAALDPDQALSDESVSLGFLEQAPLPLLDALIVGIHGPTGAQVLVAGEKDPIGKEVEPIATLGFVESYPVNPRSRPHAELPFRARGLVRGVDRRGRRHVYGIGGLPEGELIGELGALIDEPFEEAIPAWMRGDGKLVTDRYAPSAPRPGAPLTARWVGAPLRWVGSGIPLGARARAAARRVLDLPAAFAASRAHPAPPGGEPSGYLWARRADRRLPLYAAVHPVTGDQLLTSLAREATDMGYANVELLGYLLDAAPITGVGGLRETSIPWASRFGQNAGKR
jgi:glycosyltransferase involved in cell wall biosynthesis